MIYMTMLNLLAVGLCSWLAAWTKSPALAAMNIGIALMNAIAVLWRVYSLCLALHRVGKMLGL